MCLSKLNGSVLHQGGTRNFGELISFDSYNNSVLRQVAYYSNLELNFLRKKEKKHMSSSPVPAT